MGFYEMDSMLIGRYVIVGSTDRGHLLLDCLENHMIVQNLNHSYGIPEGGFQVLVMRSFSSFIDALMPDPKGTWMPLPPYPK
jgi:hypothetical protein